MKEIANLHSLMEHIREATLTKTSRGWSSIDEYALMFTFSYVYNPDNIIEVGTCNGVSSMSFAMGLRNKPGHVYTWDLFAKQQVDAGTDLSPKIIRHIGDYTYSDDVLNTISGRKLFFIDGDHSIEGCLKDIVTSLPYFNQGDTMVFHDANSYPGVSKAITRALNELPKLKAMVTRRIHLPGLNGFEVLETRGL
jgi:predicted O-methyltransferase YrrM